MGGEDQSEDLRFSGPSVWPKLSADHAWDRYIFRRPELAYLESMRRASSQRTRKGLLPDLSTIRVRIQRIRRQEKKEVVVCSTSFFHTVLDEKLEDVRTFLKELRGMMARTLPDAPALDSSVIVRFEDPDDGTYLTSFKEKWT